MWLPGRASVTIAAPPAEIWEWLVDRDKQERWLKDEMEWLPSDRSQLRAGYRGTEIMQMREGPQEARIEILEYDAPRKMRVRQEHERFVARSRFELRPSGTSTRITSATLIRYRSLLTWLGVLPILPMYSRVIRGGLKELKQLVEEGA